MEKYNIKQVTNNESFLNICDKLKEVPDCKIKESAFYSYMVAGKFNRKTISFISDKNNKMNGCVVLTLAKDLSADLVLFIVFIWIDKHFPRLWIEYMKFIENTAREFKAKRISFTTARNAEAIERKIGKYDYKKKYNVFEKNVG